MSARSVEPLLLPECSRHCIKGVLVLRPEGDDTGSQYNPTCRDLHRRPSVIVRLTRSTRQTLVGPYEQALTYSHTVCIACSTPPHATTSFETVAILLVEPGELA
jgi:hypothetical protein